MICYLEFTQVIMNPAPVGKKMTQRIWYLTVILINPGMPTLSKVILSAFYPLYEKEKDGLYKKYLAAKITSEVGEKNLPWHLNTNPGKFCTCQEGKKAFCKCARVLE